MHRWRRSDSSSPEWGCISSAPPPPLLGWHWCSHSFPAADIFCCGQLRGGGDEKKKRWMFLTWHNAQLSSRWPPSNEAPRLDNEVDDVELFFISFIARKGHLGVKKKKDTSVNTFRATDLDTLDGTNTVNICIDYSVWKRGNCKVQLSNREVVVEDGYDAADSLTWKDTLVVNGSCI